MKASSHKSVESAVRDQQHHMNQMNQRSDVLLRFLAWICPDHLFEEIAGDLLEKYERDKAKGSTRRATRRYVWNAIRFFRPGIILRKKALAKLNMPGLLHSLIDRFQALKSTNFQRTNNATGWLVFGIALITYFLTVEETASYWDCGEFIAVSYKLQVPHPPGAPLFLLMGRIFSFFAFGDVTKVAYAINMLSVLASAFTILFLFWSIVLIGRKMTGISAVAPPARERTWLLMGAGAVGALAYAFSDSFWFSAVEAEVYALSSFFTAFVIWGILKWELIGDKSKANRWLLIIAYMIGLSIGVHLLNLLTLPALALIYYFKTWKPGTRGVVATLAVSGGLIILINDFIIPGLPTLVGDFEIFFVNTLGLFFGSGAIFFSLLLTGGLIYGIYHTHQKNYPAWNTFLLAASFILIGYGSYATIVIRSNFDTPINENAPKDVMSFVRYLKREQYGTRPLLFGTYFTARPIGYTYGAATYIKGKDRYEPGGRKFDYDYEPGEETILPRAWSSESKDDYKSIMGLQEGQKPTFAQNIYFMLQHQAGTMYMRYFMWNFAGRESDLQGADWLKPAAWFKSVPAELAHNKGRNNFFMIPFFLGLLGMFWQFVKDTKYFSVIALLFVMLGFAIVIYLNSPPVEPRERDYIYVGSYYAFSFWIGLAVIGIADGLKRIIGNQRTVAIVSTLIGLAAPVIMMKNGWNDHDRSGRFFSVDAASNSLVSCAPDGILFTGGDNDTFPLWYAQETEGCRTDVRVMVLSYCNTDWYIDQTTRKAYQSDPFPYTLRAKDYRQGGLNDYLPCVDAKIKSMDAGEYLQLLAKEFTGLREGDHNMVPSRILTLTIDKKAVLAKGIIPKELEGLVVDQMQIKLLGDQLEKRDIVFLDLLVTTNWERPIYLNNTSMAQMNMDLSPYAVQEGNAYQILPVKNPGKDRPYLVDTERSYDLLLNKFRYRGLNDPDVYYNGDYKIPVLTHRSNLNALAQALIDEGQIEKASKVLQFSLDKMPDEGIPYDPSTPDTVSLLFQVGQKSKALEIANVLGNRANEMASYLISEGGNFSYELRKNIFVVGALQRTLYENGEEVLAKQFDDDYARLITDLQSKTGAGQSTN